MTPIGVVGAVSGRLHPEMKVEVVADDDAGGFHILKWWPGSAGFGPNGAFDDWVESRAELENYWLEAGWTVQWAEVPNTCVHRRVSRR
ncbi:MAG: hypothetical protein ACRDD1_00380 [Planctomycetia bacterium]